MAKYMMIYRGAATDLTALSEEQAAEVLGKWQTWMDRVGSALVDIGAPFGSGTSVVDDGGSEEALSLSGYSIVEAKDLPEAATLTQGHPFLSEGSGNFAIDVFELAPVPFEA
jgi:hypothetical protein